MQIRIGQAATCFSTPDDISSWRTVVERTARQILRRFSREFSRWAAGTILATPCQVFTAQASLPVGGAAPG